MKIRIREYEVGEETDSEHVAAEHTELACHMLYEGGHVFLTFAGFETTGIELIMTEVEFDTFLKCGLHIRNGTPELEMDENGFVKFAHGSEMKWPDTSQWK